MQLGTALLGFCTRPPPLCSWRGSFLDLQGAGWVDEVTAASLNLIIIVLLPLRFSAAPCIAGLMLQLILFPDSLDESRTAAPKPAVEKLPDVSVTDDIFAIRRAFKEAERQGQRSAAESSSERD